MAAAAADEGDTSRGNGERCGLDGVGDCGCVKKVKAFWWPVVEAKKRVTF
jgi:hypothetical protein